METDISRNFVIAEMNTHHFMFRGAGHDQESARLALLMAWRVHRNALLETYPERRDSIPDEESVEKHFKIHYLEFVQGGGYRDGDRLV